MIKSPLNYTGGKFRLLPQILPLLPPCRHFYDLFCGGFNVGINITAEKVIAVDNQCQVIELYQRWHDLPLETTLLDMETLRAIYSLSKQDQAGYLRLRDEYNQYPNALLFYGLITNSFNHQIRFNQSGKFNMPFGKARSEYNPALRSHLIKFISSLHKQVFEFVCADFEHGLRAEPGDLVYCDPPYLIAHAAYNVHNPAGAWTDEDDERLMTMLDTLHNRGVHFAMSNTMSHHGKTNDKLLQWSNRYQVHYLNADYSNCSYHKLDRCSESVEVLITSRETRSNRADGTYQLNT